MQPKKNKPHYLDVSEFMLKEHSPVFKPDSFIHASEISRPSTQLTPQFSPVLDSRLNLSITPVFESLVTDPYADFYLEDLDDFSLDGASRRKDRKPKRSKTRDTCIMHLIDNELQRIIEENYSEDFEECSDEDSVAVSSSEQQEISDQSEEEIHQGEPEKQSITRQDVFYQFKAPQWQCSNPKKELVTKLRQIAHSQDSKGDEEKVGEMKLAIEKYLCEYEKAYFDESMACLRRQQPSVSEMLGILVKGIDQSFKRVVGGLPFEKRRIKLLRYLDKKKRRVWRKKVSYDCRKKVADGRLRIKGKFVTHEQACEQLGLPSIDGFTSEQVKQMLYKKLEHN